jgi:hypothetical protein
MAFPQAGKFFVRQQNNLRIRRRLAEPKQSRGAQDGIA